MDAIPLLFVVLTATTISSLLASCAAILWLRVSASTFPTNRLKSLELQAADLQSASDILHAAHKKMYARLAMRESRERAKDSEVPIEADVEPSARKAELRRILGLYGPDAARVAQNLHRKTGSE